MKIIFLMLFILINFQFVSANFGFDNTDIPSLRITQNVTTITTYNSINNTNSSDYWDNIDTINTTQMENNNGVLNILESWLTTFIDAWLGTKTTDDLTQGSTNFYDNRSWNQSYADTLYGSGGGNSSWNESYANTLYETLGAGGNLSWNESYANDIYVDIAGDTMNGNLTLNGTDVKITDATDTVRMYYENGALVVGWD